MSAAVRCALLLCAALCASAYQDNGHRNQTFWPPLKGGAIKTQGTRPFIVNECRYGRRSRGREERVGESERGR